MSIVLQTVYLCQFARLGDYDCLSILWCCVVILGEKQYGVLISKVAWKMWTKICCGGLRELVILVVGIEWVVHFFSSIDSLLPADYLLVVCASASRGFHATSVKRMGGHGHDEPYYLHAKHMYNLHRMKHQKLTAWTSVVGAVSIGIAVPVYAVIFQQQKTASGWAYLLLFLIAFSEVKSHFTSPLLFRVTPFALGRCSESISRFFVSVYVNNTHWLGALDFPRLWRNPAVWDTLLFEFFLAPVGVSFPQFSSVYQLIHILAVVLSAENFSNSVIA